MRFFATAAKGTEPALRDELRELRLSRVRADRGGVHFEGEMVDAGRACLWSRVASRILVEVAAFDAPDAASLYAGARELDWERWVRPHTTVAVRASCRSSRLTHSQFVAQKTKDAVVDVVRDRLGSRPDVDRDDPDVLLSVHVLRDRATVYLDVGGASLQKRGWRARAGEAPLREGLAAAVVRLSGWDRTGPLLDPMCGAGTLAIEAACWSRRIAPGLSRTRFGFERWADHDDEARARVRRLRDDARAAAISTGPPVHASDADPLAVEQTRANARAAGVDVVVERRDVRDLSGAEGGVIVTNPPYGERLEAAPALYEDLARSLRRLRGATAAILAGTPAIPRAMRREPDRWWRLFNGPLECRLVVYSLP